MKATATPIASASCSIHAPLPAFNFPLNRRSRSTSLLGLNRETNSRVSVTFRTSNTSPKASLRSDVEAAAGAPASVPVRVAHELVQAGHRYLDVRTPEEFSAGHASGAVNIPYMYRVGSGMTKNTRFIEEVSARFRKDDEIIVGCQSGQRSLKAATDLLADDFTAVTDMAGGYAAWTQNGLPIES